MCKREYFFEPDNLPENYMLFLDDATEKLFRRNPKERQNPFNYPVGITTYDNFYSNAELKQIENNVEHTEAQC